MTKGWYAKAMNLYQIDEKINSLLSSAIDEDTGEILNQFAMNELEELQMERPRKVENTALFVKNCLADADAIDAEIKALTKRRDAKRKLAENTKKYLAQYLDGEKFSSAKVAVSFRKSEAVFCPDVLKLPAKYLKYSDPTADKVAIKKALKAGEIIPGATLTVSNNIQIE